jgi:hypothetical protein
VQTLAERDPLAAAKRGLLFVVLGLILCDKAKALGEEELFARLVDEFGLPEGAWGVARVGAGAGRARGGSRAQ